LSAGRPRRTFAFPTQPDEGDEKNLEQQTRKILLQIQKFSAYLCTPFQKRLIGSAGEEVEKLKFFRLKFGKSENNATFALPSRMSVWKRC
jgi:hypothetical protein